LGPVEPSLPGRAIAKAIAKEEPVCTLAAPELVAPEAPAQDVVSRVAGNAVRSRLAGEEIDALAT
jgi:hypothetical protein